MKFLQKKLKNFRDQKDFGLFTSLFIVAGISVSLFLFSGTSVFAADNFVVGYAKDVLLATAYIPFYLSGQLLTLMGWILDSSIAYTLDKTSLMPEAIESAWRAVRDITNIVFIFVLIYISIMTILRAGGFETKKMLTSLVVVALLVNFSLFFSQVVIDASNILASTFHTQVASEGISVSLMNGLGLQTIFDEKFLEDLNSFDLELSIYVFMTILMLIAAFSFGVAAIMFVIRSVALMFLMVLSPLAFVANIVPGTSGYFTLWWKNLLRYSFYAPAYILLIVLTVSIVGDGSLLPGQSGSKNFAEAFTAWFGSQNASPSYLAVFFQYAIVIGLIYGSYVLAKQFGLMGAETVMKGAQSVRKFGQGAILGALGGAAGAVVARPLRGVLGKSAENTLSEGGAISKSLRYIPGYRSLEGTALGALGKAGRKDVEEQKKKLEGLSVSSLQKITSSATSPFNPSSRREAAVQLLASTKNLKTEGGLEQQDIQDRLTSMEERGISKKTRKEIEGLQWQYKDLKELAKDAPSEEEGTGVKRVAEIIRKIPKDSIDDLDEDFFKNTPDNKELFKAMYSGITKAQISRLLDEKPAYAESFINGLGEVFDKNAKNIITELKGQNSSLVSWIRSPEGKNELADFKSLPKDKKDKEDGLSPEDAEKKLGEGLRGLDEEK